MTRTSFLVAFRVLCYVVLATSISAFAIPAASTALSVRNLVDSFLGVRDGGSLSEERELRKRDDVTITEIYVLESTIATKTITTDTIVKETLTLWETTISYPGGTPPPVEIPIITYSSTTTTTVTPSQHRLKRQNDNFSVDSSASDTTTTRTILTRKRVTATKTKYSTTLIDIVATTTHVVTTTPNANATRNDSGLWTQITWQIVTVTVRPDDHDGSDSGAGGGRARSVKKGAVAGGVLGGLAAVAGLVGFCILLRRRNMRRIEENSNKRKKHPQISITNTVYSSIPGVSVDSEDTLESKRPESESLMGGVDAPQTPGFHYSFGPPGVGAYESPLPPPNPIPGTPTVIPPSSTFPLRTDFSPRNSKNPFVDSEIGISMPAQASRRNESYAHLSPTAASAEFRSPPPHRRTESLSSNIMPPPLQEYNASRPVSEISPATTLRGRDTSNGSSFYSETDPETGTGSTASWGKYGENVRRKPAPAQGWEAMRSPEVNSQSALLQQQHNPYSS